MQVMESKSQVELLHEISNIVSSNLSLEKMLQELIGLAVEVTNCDACLVYLVDKGRKEIVLRASQLPHTKEIGHIKLKMGEGITGWVAQNKSVVALGANAAADSRFKSFQKLQEDTYQAFLSVPLISEGELIGVINIHHKAEHAHTQDEIAPGRFPGRTDGRRHHQRQTCRALRACRPPYGGARRTRGQTQRKELSGPHPANHRGNGGRQTRFAGLLHHAGGRGAQGTGDQRRALLLGRLPAPRTAQDRGLPDRPCGARGRADPDQQRARRETVPLPGTGA